MSNEQGMPALPSGCLETDRPIWKHITAWGDASIGEAAGCLADKIDAAITDLVHTYAREYAAQQTAELRAQLTASDSALRESRANDAASVRRVGELQSRLDEAVVVLGVLLRAHETLLIDCKLQAGGPTKAARAFLAVQGAV
jgi:hypothetical protein